MLSYALVRSSLLIFHFTCCHTVFDKRIVIFSLIKQHETILDVLSKKLVIQTKFCVRLQWCML